MSTFGKPGDIRFGIIGYGGSFNIPAKHVKDCTQAGMTHVAVSEIDPERLKAAKEDFPDAEVYDSVEKMLNSSDVNLLVIITPHNTHAPIALQCLNAGKHVVCEKPLAISTDECDQMIAAADKNNLLLTTYHNRHWDGCILKAMETVRSDALGDVTRITANKGVYKSPREWWRSSKSISGGILFDWGVHLLEYAFQIIDSRVTEVSGFAKTGYWKKQSPWKDDTNEDEVSAVIRFENGVWMTLTVSSLSHTPSPYWIKIAGTEGHYAFNGKKWELTRHDGTEPYITNGDSPPSKHLLFYQNVVDHLVGGAPLVISPDYARRLIHVLDLACQSAEKGGSLKPRYS